MNNLRLCNKCDEISKIKKQEKFYITTTKRRTEEDEEKIKETNNFENNPKNTKQKIDNMDNLQAPVKKKYKSKNKDTEKINVLNVGENDFDTKEVVNKEMKESKEKNNEI